MGKAAHLTHREYMTCNRLGEAQLGPGWALLWCYPLGQDQELQMCTPMELLGPSASACTPPTSPSSQPMGPQVAGRQDHKGLWQGRERHRMVFTFSLLPCWPGGYTTAVCWPQGAPPLHNA